MSFHRLIAVLICLHLFSGELIGQDDKLTDEQAITASISGYVNAMNRGDAKTAASHWSAKGEWINPQGETIAGAEAIEKELAAMFTGEGGPKIELEDLHVRFISDTVAAEEGFAIVTRPGGIPVRSSYISIHVKTESGWKIDSVRETRLPGPESNHQHLSELEWMIGDWIDKDEDVSVETICDWTSNKNFLLRTFRATKGGELQIEGTQIIGWDAARNQIRSWVFDSDGGFGHGHWTRNGSSWDIEAEFQTSDGGSGSSINRFTYIDANKFSYGSTNRMLNGEELEDVEPIIISRVTETAEEKAGK